MNTNNKIFDFHSFAEFKTFTNKIFDKHEMHNEDKIKNKNLVDETHLKFLFHYFGSTALRSFHCHSCCFRSEPLVVHVTVAVVEGNMDDSMECCYNVLLSI